MKSATGEIFKNARCLLLRHPAYVVDRLSYYFPLQVNELLLYQDVWNWQYLQYNEHVVNLPEWQTLFKQTRAWTDMADEYNSDWMFVQSAVLTKVHPLEKASVTGFLMGLIDENEADLSVHSLINQMDKHPELQWVNPEDVIYAPTTNWSIFSQNTVFNWSADWIQMHADVLDWYWLSQNESLPWSEQLIARFEYAWEWGGVRTMQGSTFEMAHIGLLTNPAISWTHSMLRRFQSRLCWETLCQSEHVCWSFEILNEFEQVIDWNGLVLNTAAWEQTFGTFSKPQLMAIIAEIQSSCLVPLTRE